eukprot:scaffold2238_cov117-Isochrysis_galbana.AAC.3
MTRRCAGDGTPRHAPAPRGGTAATRSHASHAHRAAGGGVGLSRARVSSAARSARAMRVGRVGPHRLTAATAPQRRRPAEVRKRVREAHADARAPRRAHQADAEPDEEEPDRRDGDVPRRLGPTQQPDTVSRRSARRGTEPRITRGPALEQVRGAVGCRQLNLSRLDLVRLDVMVHRARGLELRLCG